MLLGTLLAAGLGEAELFALRGCLVGPGIAAVTATVGRLLDATADTRFPALCSD